MMGDKRKQAAKDKQPFMPSEQARQRGEIPTGRNRNDDYGQGRKSGVVADDKEKAQEAELEMNEENR